MDHPAGGQSVVEPRPPVHRLPRLLGAGFQIGRPHFGTLADYQQLAQALHGRGMYLVQDIVVNHIGNFFGYDEGFVAGDAVRGYVQLRRRGQGAGGRGNALSQDWS